MTDIYGVMGNPVEHSLSPPMHAAAYESTGVEATYLRFLVEEGDVKEAVRGAGALNIDGLNVTVPHKGTVAALPSVELDENAERIGAVNTLDFGVGEDEEASEGDDSTVARGYNTDASGALRALERKTEVAGKKAVLVGAGGAARAIAFALAGEGAAVEIVNRTVERAEKLADEVREAVGTSDVSAHPLDTLDDVVPDADIVVNATTVGMEEDVSPVPADALRPHHIVFDAVYTPLDTRLLRDAAEVGATTVDGAWMLVYQGAEAFEIWTGRTAPVEKMNAALREGL
ncbi:MAG: shikimate dehydrogenase [Halobacteriales archaeon]|nr:shikimate dehydrogenase [Halobacteriales archaeon]